MPLSVIFYFRKLFFMKKKKILFLIFLVFVIFTPSFSQTTELSDTLSKSKQEKSVESDLKTVLGTIVNICGSIYIKILATASLTYIGINFIISQDKRAFLKSVYGWILACIIIVSIPGIVSGIMNISDSIQSLQTYSLVKTPGYSNIKNKK